MDEMLWDHYNARGLSPEMVARTFVAPQQFVTISKPRNTVVFGARGSGKTTLLRMLEPRAQLLWSKREDAAPPISALAIFVPIDASWLASLRQAVSCASELSDSVSLCVYSLAAVRSAVDVMIYRTKDAVGRVSPYSANLVAEDEAKLAIQISKILHLSSEALSLRDLRFSITAELAHFPRRVLDMPESDRQRVFSALLDPVLLTATVCDLFNVLADELDRKWIVLCDEVEIAPKIVQEQLFRALRATPSPVILKIALTPVVTGLGSSFTEQPLPAHDYDAVSLSYPSREEGQTKRFKEEFCLALWHQLYIERFPEASTESQSPFRVLAQPDLARVVRRRGAKPASKSGTRISRYTRLFQSLSEIDPTFAQYLEGKGVDPNALDRSSPDQFDAVIRKVAAIAELRLYFLSGTTAGPSATARKSFAWYAGAAKIFDISEGHPRWLKATIGAMLDRVEASGIVSIASQASELRHSVERLNSRISAIPATHHSASAQSLVAKIGAYFQQEVLGKRFKADPIQSFVVDESVSESVMTAIEDGLFIGALIPLSNESSGLMQGGVRGRRLRLSNWLAPQFHLPLTLGKAVSLSKILNQQASDNQLGLDV